MDANDLLLLFKADIGVMNDRRNPYFLTILNSAMGFISNLGINLNGDDDEDRMLVVIYAAYLKERREKGPAAMPDYLSRALKNRLAQEKMRVSDV